MRIKVDRRGQYRQETGEIPRVRRDQGPCALGMPRKGQNLKKSKRKIEKIAKQVAKIHYGGTVFQRL